MNACEEFQSLLSAWIDGELSPTDAADVATHVADCRECRACVDALRELDANLVGFAARNQTTADRIAAAVLTIERDQVTHTPPRADVRLNATAHPRTITRVRTIAQYLAAAAAGYLLAWLLFAPRGNRPTPENPVATNGTLTLARLTVATGAVTMRQPGQTDWSSADPKSPFSCSIGTEVRTPPGVQCELETKDRCTIRLNGETKLTLRSPSEVELHSGQI